MGTEWVGFSFDRKLRKPPFRRNFTQSEDCCCNVTHRALVGERIAGSGAERDHAFSVVL